MPNTKVWIASALTLVLLNGCGGGSSSSGTTSTASAATAQGVFTDSPVQGLRYVSGKQSGYTDSKGGFTYAKGKTVSFYIGDILVGQTTGQAIVTPVDLVSGAKDQTNPTVSNIAQFLQSLDADGNPSNGITITSQESRLAAGASVNFKQSTTAFAGDGNVQTLVAKMTAVTSAGARGLVSASTAQGNLQNTLLGLLAGNWSGTYGGGDSGTWSVSIDTTGNITGSGKDQTYGGFRITGTVASSGTATFAAGGASGAQVAASYKGSFDAKAGTGSGTWTSGCCTGTWSGSKQ
ncbi:MAG: hypothetical protein P8124_08295 [Gammaproteobacteria bacterium]